MTTINPDNNPSDWQQLLYGMKGLCMLRINFASISRKSTKLFEKTWMFIPEFHNGNVIRDCHWLCTSQCPQPRTGSFTENLEKIVIVDTKLEKDVKKATTIDRWNRLYTTLISLNFISAKSKRYSDFHCKPDASLWLHTSSSNSKPSNHMASQNDGPLKIYNEAHTQGTDGGGAAVGNGGRANGTGGKFRRVNGPIMIRSRPIIESLYMKKTAGNKKIQTTRFARKKEFNSFSTTFPPPAHLSVADQIPSRAGDFQSSNRSSVFASPFTSIIGDLMKSTKQKEEASKSSAKRKATRNTTSLSKSTNISKVQHPNATRAKVELHKKHADSQEKGCSGLEKVVTPVAADKLPSGGHEHPAVLFPSAKIKLQLFPIDERIQMEIEKDGHNPHLELTLSVRKKISSVLSHLNNKWGNSTASLGDPILFPFNIELENLAAYRCWTLKDISITAGDVYKAIGCPAIFRLRYGWFSTQDKDFPLSDVSPEACNILETSTPTKVISEELKAVTAGEQLTISAVERLPPAYISNIEGRGLGNGGSHASALWFDSLSNISFGALLSEESLLGKCSMLFPKSNDDKCVSQPSQLLADSMDAFITNHLKSAQEPEEYRSGFQPSQMVADSLDAFIINHLKNFQEPNSNKEELPPSQVVSDTFDASVAKYLGNAQQSRTLSAPSSILDAEETCHSFALKKPHSSEKESFGDGRRFFAALSAQDSGLKSHNSTKATEAINNVNGSADHRPEPEACSRGLFNEESSLGFSKINWTDSMGPFDLSLSSQQKIKGDNVSLSEFVR
ncbi:hypothetical protein V2J09_009737 [Rumex salicifolius]